MIFFLKLVIFVFLFNLVFVTNAYAYLDPNAGGFFLQVVMPFVFGAAAAITVFWRRILVRVKDVISRLLGRNNSESTDT